MKEVLVYIIDFIITFAVFGGMFVHLYKLFKES